MRNETKTLMKSVWKRITFSNDGSSTRRKALGQTKRRKVAMIIKCQQA